MQYNLFKRKLHLIKRNLKSSFQSTDISQNDDSIFLVEYPKCGITFFSVLLSSYLKGFFDVKITPNYFNIGLFVKDIHIFNSISNSNYFPFKLLKSHSEFNENYHIVFLLIRKPSNVLISYYYYLKNENRTNLDFKTFCRKKGIKILQDYNRFVKDWITKSSKSQRFFLVKYEDLIENPKKVLTNISNILGFDYNEGFAEFAIKNSSKENMLHNQKIINLYDPRERIDFVRSSSNLHDESLSIELENKHARYISKIYK